MDDIYEISENPVYNPQIRKLKNSDPANADTIFNPLFSQIINNVHSLKVSSDALSEVAKSGSYSDLTDKPEPDRFIKREITIPAYGWKDASEEEKENRFLYVDIAQEDVTEDMTPIVSIIPSDIEKAKKCGMSTACRTLDEKVRFYAEKSPSAEIHADLILLQSHSGAAGGGGTSTSYVLPTATQTRLGGVKIGDNVKVANDGTISVDGTGLLDEAAAADEDVRETLDSVFGLTKQDKT